MIIFINTNVLVCNSNRPKMTSNRVYFYQIILKIMIYIITYKICLINNFWNRINMYTVFLIKKIKLNELCNSLKLGNIKKIKAVF